MTAWKVWGGIACATAAGSAFAAETPCDPASLQAATQQLGYRYDPATGYCEGLVREKQANDLQLLYLMSRRPIGDVVPTLYITVPKVDTAGLPVEIHGSSALRGVTYRFDALAKAGDVVALDATRMLKQARILPDSLVFFAQIKDSFPARLVPLSISAERQPMQNDTFAVGLRVPVDLKGRRMRLVPAAGIADVAWIDSSDAMSAGLVRIPLPHSAPGSYRLELKLQPTLPLDPLVLTRDVVIP